MEKAKLFMNGQSQAVRLPKEYRFSSKEVGIKKVGEIVLLFPYDSIWEEFLRTVPATDDFTETVLKAREENYQGENREPL